METRRVVDELEIYPDSRGLAVEGSEQARAQQMLSETNNATPTRIVHDLHMAIDAAFREHGICITFPQRDVHLDTLSPLEARVSHLGGPRVEGSENV